MSKAQVTIGSTRAPMMPPDDLPAEARDVWVELVDGLAEYSILDKVDAVSIETLTRIITRWRAAEKQMDQDGLFLVHPNGHIYAHPAWKVAHDAKGEFMKLGAKFGLTPKDRVELGIEVMTAESMKNEIELQIGPSPRRRGS